MRKNTARGKLKELTNLFRKFTKKGKQPNSAQESIPYIQMYKDGICHVKDNHYTKTIQFHDINYQLSQNDEKTAIFENWCDFLNYFNNTISVQLSFFNQSAHSDELVKLIDIPQRNDDFDDIRSEYSDMLKSQLAKGNNGLVKLKYITFGIDADTLKMARSRLERIETDVHNNFKVLGVDAHTLNGHERLKLLFDTLHNNGREKFNFDWNMLPESGLTTKDFIAPSSFDFTNSRIFSMGNRLGSASFIQILANELSDTMLSDLLDTESNLIVTMHIKAIDHTEAVKLVKRKLTDVNAMKIDAQKKAIQNGYDMDIISPDLMTYGDEAKTLLQDLQNRNEKMYLVTFIVINFADTKRQLENDVFSIQNKAQVYSCPMIRLDYQQENALMSSLPLGLNQIDIQRGLTTSSTAVFIPFITQELFQSGEALYYGLNALSNNMIMVDRKRLKNPNGLILGTPGSGKSFSAKREITNIILITNDDVIICDPESEVRQEVA